VQPTDAIAFVRRYNAWRRNDNDSYMPHPKDIGQALDALCDHAERLERELAVWKHGTMLLEAELEKFDETAISWWCEYQDLKAKARQ
jgi:hypothetical protein